MTTRVWWNESPPSTWHDLVACWAASEDGPVEVVALASSIAADHPVLDAAEEVLPEPAPSLADEAYVAQALAICQEHEVDIVVPWTRLRAMAAAADLFEAVGTHVLAPPAVAVAIAEDKAQLYARAAALGLEVPDHHLATTPAEFDRGLVAIRSLGRPVCVRSLRHDGPNTVRVVVGTLPPERLDHRRPLVTDDAVRAGLAAGTITAPVQVLRYLDGVRWTIDVLAWHGRVVAAIPRRRDPLYGVVLLERAPLPEAVAAAVVEGWGLHGVVNIQVVMVEGKAYLTEVVPRPGRGLHWSGHTGVSLTYEAIVAAVEGEPEPALAGVVDEVLPMRLVQSGAPLIPED